MQSLKAKRSQLLSPSTDTRPISTHNCFAHFCSFAPHCIEALLFLFICLHTFYSLLLGRFRLRFNIICMMWCAFSNISVIVAQPRSLTEIANIHTAQHSRDTAFNWKVFCEREIERRQWSIFFIKYCRCVYAACKRDDFSRKQNE